MSNAGRRVAKLCEYRSLKVEASAACEHCINTFVYQACNSIRLQIYMFSMSWDLESTSEFGEASIAQYVPYPELDLSF